MKASCQRLLVIVIVVSFFALPGCARMKPVPEQAMDFEPGLQALADNLASQLENTGSVTRSNPRLLNPRDGKHPPRKLAIDPFIDTESGAPVKVAERIRAVITREMSRRFAVADGDIKSGQLSEYVLAGMVSSEEGSEMVHKVYAAVVERSSGVVQASAHLRIRWADVAEGVALGGK